MWQKNYLFWEMFLGKYLKVHKIQKMCTTD